MNNKKLIRLALTKSEESRMEFLTKDILNVEFSIDEYFNKKFNKIIDGWKNNLKDLSKILIKSNKIECVMYLLYKYDIQKYVSYYTGYYNNNELYKTGVVLNNCDIISGAIKNEHFDMVKTVLEKTPNYSIGWNIWDDFLISSVKCDKNEIFNYLLEKFKTTSCSLESARIMKKCIIYNKLELLKLVFEKYPSSADYIYDCHIECAIMQNNHDMVKFLLEKSKSNIKFERIFNYVLRSKNLDIIKLFIYKGVIYDNFDICINFAAENNCLEILKWCFEPINYKYRPINASQASIIAAKNGHIDIIKFLFENKYFKSEEMGDIAYIAAGRGYQDIVKYAVDNGADNFINIVKIAKNNGFEEIANTYSKYID